MLHDLIDENYLKQSPFAWWEWDIVQNKVRFNELKVSMLGYTMAEFSDGGYQKFTNILHPDDFEKTMEAMRRVLRNETDLYYTYYRIKAKNGLYHLYADRGIVIARDSNQIPLVLRGIVIDLKKESENICSQQSLIELLQNTAKTKERGSSTILTICSSCKKAKCSNASWITITNELAGILAHQISHGICPDCIKKLYPDIADEILSRFTNTN